MTTKEFIRKYKITESSNFENLPMSVFVARFGISCAFNKCKNTNISFDDEFKLNFLPRIDEMIDRLNQMKTDLKKAGC